MATASEKKRVSVDPKRGVAEIAFVFEQYNLAEHIDDLEAHIEDGKDARTHWFAKLLKKYKIKDMHAIERDPNYEKMVMGQENIAVAYVAKILGVKVPGGHSQSYSDNGVLNVVFDLPSNEAALRLLKLRYNEANFEAAPLIEGVIEAIWPHGPKWRSDEYGGRLLVKTDAYYGWTDGLEVMDVDDWIDIVAPAKRPTSKRPAPKRR